LPSLYRNHPTAFLGEAALDARAAFVAHQNNLQKLAQDWARRSAQHYALFYKVAPARVRQFASINEQHILVGAFVVGWEERKPVLYWEKGFLDEGAFPPHSKIGAIASFQRAALHDKFGNARVDRG
jgi:hypothetical protein